jgi:type III secretory pathway component EscS
VPNPPSEKEIAIIIRASHELSSTRLVSVFPASVAIATLVYTLATAIVQTIKQINENNTRIDIKNIHTIAVVFILFISIPQVWFSARLSIFTTESGAIHIINTMNSRLNRLKGKDRLSTFPTPGQVASCPLQYFDRRPSFMLWFSGRLPERF